MPLGQWKRMKWRIILVGLSDSNFRCDCKFDLQFSIRNNFCEVICWNIVMCCKILVCYEQSISCEMQIAWSIHLLYSWHFTKDELFFIKDFFSKQGFQLRPATGDFRRPLNHKLPESCRAEIRNNNLFFLSKITFREKMISLSNNYRYNNRFFW